MATTPAVTPVLRVDDFEPAAHAVLPLATFDYIAGGAEDEATVKANRDAFGRYFFRYKVMTGAAEPNLVSEVFNQRFTMPVHLAPTAIHRIAHPQGEAAAYRAASDVGVAFCLSTLASMSIEDVAAAASGPRWFQLYMPPLRDAGTAFVERAEAAGYSAILFTVDLPKTGHRERDIRNVFRLPDGIHYANLGAWTPTDTAVTPGGMDPFAKDVNLQTHAGLSWEDLTWLVGKTRLPIIVKGIVRGDDARRAVDAGARGLIVSNHGGRQLDYAVASLDALPDVVEAVDGRVPILLDGGVRRGTDVIKALCLGASGVLIGRPYLYALAVGGADGVRRLLEILRYEIALSMTLLGATRLSELNRDLLVRV